MEYFEYRDNPFISLNLEYSMGFRDIIGKDTWVRTAYRRIRRCYVTRREISFLRLPLYGVHHTNCHIEPPPNLLLITIAYNRADMIGHQLRLLPKYLSDSFRHIVVDNSSDRSVRHKIERLCKERGVGYVSLPHNFYTYSSNSHGLALNWVYRHLVLAINPQYVGFLDHDVFPIRNHSILEILASQPAYGPKEVRGNASYLWPGFSFYQTSLLMGKNVDFKPGVMNGAIVDTGGMLPINILFNNSKQHPVFAEACYERIVSGSAISSNTIEWLKIDGINTWLHCLGAGH